MPTRLLLLALLLLGACAAPPRAPLELSPPAAVRVDHFAGSVVSGPQPLGQPGPLEEAAVVSVRLLALERLPAERLQPLAGQVRLALCCEMAQPVLGASALLEGGRAGRVADVAETLAELEEGRWGRAELFASRAACLPAGATVEVAARRDLADAGQPEREGVALRVHRTLSGEGLDLGLTLRGRVDGALRSEQVVLERIEGQARLHWAAVVPSPFSAGGGALAVLVGVQPAPEPGEPGHARHRQELVRCRADLARARTLAVAQAEATRVEGEPPLAAPALATALRGLTVPEGRRGALVTLASGNQAPLTADAALGLEGPLLEELAEACALAASQTGTPARGPELGLILERASLGVLLERVEVGGDDALYALLLRHVGALALRIGALRQLLEVSSTARAWRRGLVDENLNLLEEGDLVVRARAFSYLAARGRTPRGYDPAGPPAERAAALEASRSPADEEAR